MTTSADVQDFTPEQVRTAVRVIMSLARQGRRHEAPEWMHAAKRQYNRDWARAKHQRDLADIAAGRKQKRVRNNPLKEDGIIDWEAVRITVKGTRKVALTGSERLLAVGYMSLKLGMAPVDIEKQLDLVNISRYTKAIEDGKLKDLLVKIEASDPDDENPELDCSGDPLKF